MVWPAIIAAGAAIGGQLIAGNRASSSSFEREREDLQLTRRVADAKSAGLHPLFALGATGGYSRSSTGFSGSHMGEGVARAGEAVAQGMRERTRGKVATATRAEGTAEHKLRLIKMQKEIQLDDAALMKAASDLKIAEQALMSGPRGNIVGPPGQVLGEAPMDRPIISTPRQSLPTWSEIRNPDGSVSRVLNPELGLDEVGQFEFLRQQAQEWMTDKLMQRRKLRRQKRKRTRRRVKRADPEFFGGS